MLDMTVRAPLSLEENVVWVESFEEVNGKVAIAVVNDTQAGTLWLSNNSFLIDTMRKLRTIAGMPITSGPIRPVLKTLQDHKTKFVVIARQEGNKVYVSLPDDEAPEEVDG